MLKIDHNRLISLLRKVKDNKVVRILCWPIKYLLNRLEEFRYLHSYYKKRIEEFRGRHNGARCFIIGNGSSLNISDLEALRDEVTFASNRIYRLYDKTDWRPSYWVGVDPDVLRNDREKLLDAMEMMGTMYFVVSYLKIFGEKPNLIYFLLCYTMRIDKYKDHEIKFSDNAVLGLSNGETVTYIAIQLAVFMGCREIYLIGVDHNYSLSLIEGKVICNDNIKNYPDDMGVGSHEVFSPANLVLTTHAYSVAREYCEAHGVRIANATRGGNLEVFDRVSLEDILG